MDKGALYRDLPTGAFHGNVEGLFCVPQESLVEFTDWDKARVQRGKMHGVYLDVKMFHHKLPP